MACTDPRWYCCCCCCCCRCRRRKKEKQLSSIPPLLILILILLPISTVLLFHQFLVILYAGYPHQGFEVFPKVDPRRLACWCWQRTNARHSGRTNESGLMAVFGLRGARFWCSFRTTRTTPPKRGPILSNRQQKPRHSSSAGSFVVVAVFHGCFDHGVLFLLLVVVVLVFDWHYHCCCCCRCWCWSQSEKGEATLIHPVSSYNIFIVSYGSTVLLFHQFLVRVAYIYEDATGTKS